MNYFAYGSNLCTARLLARIPKATLRMTARLDEYVLRFHKIGEDGSGKCDIVPSADPGVCVHGAIYDLSPTDKNVLDKIEGVGSGYEVAQLEIKTAGNRPIEVFTYTATRTSPTIRPYDWYRDFVLAGACEHAFPENYLTAIRNTKSIADPDPERCRSNRQILASIAFG